MADRGSQRCWHATTMVDTNASPTCTTFGFRHSTKHAHSMAQDDKRTTKGKYCSSWKMIVFEEEGLQTEPARVVRAKITRTIDDNSNKETALLEHWREFRVSLRFSTNCGRHIKGGYIGMRRHAAHRASNSSPTTFSLPRQSGLLLASVRSEGSGQDARLSQYRIGRITILTNLARPTSTLGACSAVPYTDLVPHWEARTAGRQYG